MKKFFLFSFFLFAFCLLLSSSLASAAAKPPNTNIWSPSILKGPLVVCWGGPVNAGGQDNQNACQDLCDLVSQILNIIYFMMGVVIWIATPISVAVGGIMYMLAGPNPAMVARAKTILTGVAWGIAIVLCSYVLVSTFVKVMDITGVGGFGTSACSFK